MTKLIIDATERIYYSRCTDWSRFHTRWMRLRDELSRHCEQIDKTVQVVDLINRTGCMRVPAIQQNGARAACACSRVVALARRQTYSAESSSSAVAAK